MVTPSLSYFEFLLQQCVLGPIKLQWPQVPGLRACDGDIDGAVAMASRGMAQELSSSLL